MKVPALLLLLVSVAAPSSLLVGARSTANARLTDGLVGEEGDGWLSAPAVRLRPSTSFEWDLGSSRQLGGGAIQADGDDIYVLSVSDDGSTYRDVHAFAASTAPGLRTRSDAFEARGRFVRLRGEGGDGSYSVSELQLFPDRMSLWTSPLGRPGPREPLFYPWAGLLLATAIALGLVNAGSSRARVAFVGVGLAALAAAVLAMTLGAETTGPRAIDWIRAVVAASALLAIGRTLVRRSPARASLVNGVLVVCAGLAVLCFLNLGRAQFRDVGRNAPTFLHHYDMRTYFPIAKYFPELRFDGVYAASAAAMIEDVRLEGWLGRQTMTDLRTHEHPTIRDSEEHIREVRARFTPERWREFVTDMRYFRRAMTDGGFVGTMNDHGGNATPVWFLGARLLFANAPASDFTLWTGVAADVVLMLLAFGAIGWAYGPRSALLAAIVWGAMDLYMFGSNWFGAALRHDWMALWAIGLALSKKERFFLAGGVLAWAGLIRVFPIASFITIGAPVAFALANDLRAEGRAFSPRVFLARHAGFVRFCLGALAVGGALLAASVMVFGLEAWPLWVRKISLMAGGRGINTVGLTNFISSPGLLGVVRGTITLVALWALRRAPLDHAAAFGVALVAPLFSPMNYYLHSLYLLVLLGSERRVFPWVAALAMCVGCYFTTLVEGGFERHFDAEAWNVLATGAALLVWQLVRSRSDSESASTADAEPRAPSELASGGRAAASA